MTEPSPIFDEDRVRALEDARYSAMLDRDTDGLAQLFASDAVYTHSSGMLHDKAAYLRAFQEGEFVYETISRPEENIRLLGSAAVVTGRIRLDVRFKDGPRTLDSRFLSIWIVQDGKPSHLAWHATPIPE